MATRDIRSAQRSYAFGELSEEERILPPEKGGGVKKVLWNAVLVSLGLGAAWQYGGDPLTWSPRLMGTIEEVASRLSRQTSASETSEAKPAPPPQLAKLEAPQATAAEEQREAAAPPAASAASIGEAYASTGEDAAPGQPLRRPKVDAGDAYQVRASAVGLHPELSRAVLARLTEADFRNAGIAIEKAFSDRSDAAVIVWPRAPAAGQASFEVRFVQSAARECRRYVVIVSKDGWSTTALPMERCGTPSSEGRGG